MKCQDISFFFFFNDTATTEIYTLSLHDALPIFRLGAVLQLALPLGTHVLVSDAAAEHRVRGDGDRKSTRLNSSHQIISYAVFCLKKKKEEQIVIECAQFQLQRINAPASDDCEVL